MRTETRQRLFIWYGKGFVAFLTVIGAAMLYSALRSGMTPLGRLMVVALVASLITFALTFVSLVRRVDDADMTYGVEFFTLAFAAEPLDPKERLAWVAARRLLASWLAAAASMALLVAIETLAGNWHAG